MYLIMHTCGQKVCIELDIAHFCYLSLFNEPCTSTLYIHTYTYISMNVEYQYSYVHKCQKRDEHATSSLSSKQYSSCCYGP